MKLTKQQQIVYEYIKKAGYFMPAFDRIPMLNGKIIGSQADRRARELAEIGLIENVNKNKKGKEYIYAKFVLVNKAPEKKKVWVYGEDGVARLL